MFLDVRFLGIFYFFALLGEFTNAAESGQQAPLPSGMIICRRNMPTDERNECIKESIANLIPKIKDGYSPLDIPEIDPYFIGTSRFSLNDPVVSFILNLKNSRMFGISGLKVKSLRSKINNEKLLIEFKAAYPYINIEADYKGQVNMTGLSFKPKGHFNITVYGLTCTYKLVGNISNINGEEHMIIQKFDLNDLQMKDFKADITGLLPDPDVNAFVLEFINQNWRSLSGILIGQTKAIWEPLHLDIINILFKKVPFRQLMPEE